MGNEVVRTENTSTSAWRADKINVFNYANNVFDVLVPDNIMTLEPFLAEVDDLRDTWEATMILELDGESGKAGAIDYREYRRQRSRNP
jgi:hypothetical protein